MKSSPCWARRNGPGVPGPRHETSPRCRDQASSRRLRVGSRPPARFEREAQTLASLNHPEIATLYGLEDGDTPAIVMELVEGADTCRADRRRVASRSQRRSLSLASLRQRSTRPMNAESFIATSSPPTSRSRPMDRSRCSISAWQRPWPRTRQHIQMSRTHQPCRTWARRRRHHRHRGLHESGTGARPVNGQANRYLGLRLRAVRADDGPQDVRRRDHVGCARRDPDPRNRAGTSCRRMFRPRSSIC